MKIVWNREARRWEIHPAYEPLLGGSGGGWRWPWEKEPAGVDLTEAGFYDLPFAIVRNGKLTTIL